MSTTENTTETTTKTTRKKKVIIFSGLLGTAAIALALGGAALQAEGRGGWGFDGGKGDCQRSGQHERSGRGFHSGKGGQGGMLGQLMHPKMLQQLDLSDAQQAELKALMADHKAQRQANREAMQSEKQAALSAALSEEPISADALLALSSSLNQQGEGRAQARAEHLAAVLNVLTSEQRTELLSKLSLRAK